MAHGAFSRMGGTRAYVLARGRAETTVDATEHCDSKTRLPVLPVRETALKKCYAPSPPHRYTRYIQLYSSRVLVSTWVSKCLTNVPVLNGVRYSCTTPREESGERAAVAST